MSTDELFTLIANHDIGRIAKALADGADPNTIQDDGPGWRPLHASIEELEHGGSPDVVILLLRHGADVDGWDRDEQSTPLLMAFLREQLTVVRVLIAAGASVDTLGAEGDTPLLCAVEMGDPELVRLVLLCSPTTTLERPRGLDGVNPLGLAASRLDASNVRAILAAGANPETPDADYRRPAERMPARTVENANSWNEIAALLKPES
ncbi:ankyrin repeat domain-containing protein [Rhodococcus opacus]|uniref:Uncharacterized protein n=1 Tax=Rhodococcus opacus TaxID=37919 RepID=A0A076EWG6_RHOOP|nr:ankyrin repeat domain-containing protein [Rhodococcus opacus]AII10335.1 hypothetical protein EP51_39055 [Rhodococcus opacus]